MNFVAYVWGSLRTYCKKYFTRRKSAIKWMYNDMWYNADILVLLQFLSCMFCSVSDESLQKQKENKFNFNCLQHPTDLEVESLAEDFILD